MTVEELREALAEFSPSATVRVYDPSTGYWYDLLLVRSRESNDEGEDGDPVLCISD